MDAIEGLERLARAVGSGDIEATVTVNQPYAQRQHEELGWSHPRGGRAKYLEGPLFERYPELMQMAADSLVTAEGSNIQDGMARVAEAMSRFVEDNAPRLDNILRYSGQPEVTDSGTVSYSRAPKATRVEK